MTPPGHARNTAPCGAPRYQGGRGFAWVLALHLLSVTASPACAETLFGRVVGVSDGDTITVLDAEREAQKVRLAGIDAPERRQPFGERSKQALATLLFGKQIRVEWHKRDRYGRVVGHVWVKAPGCAEPSCPKARDAALAQVEAGLAWHYKQYEKEQTPGDREQYAAAEESARMRRVGLWADGHPMPPCEWRRQSLTREPDSLSSSRSR